MQPADSSAILAFIRNFRCRRSSHSNIYSTLLHVACSIIFLSFLCFEVLDLDGSQLPLKSDPSSSSVVTVEAVAGLKTALIPQLFKSDFDFSFVSRPLEEILVRSHMTAELEILSLSAAQHRCCRIALPRSSTSDPLVPA